MNSREIICVIEKAGWVHVATSGITGNSSTHHAPAA